jgi:serine/threonine protein kinase
LKDASKKQSAEFKAVIEEAKLMSSIPPSDYVVRFIGICHEPFCLLSEFVDGGSLEAYLQQQVDLSLFWLLSFLRDIATGLAHLHQNGIIHRLVDC